MTKDSSRPALRSRPYDTIAVLGAGAWGTALASVARRAGRSVRLWGRDQAVIDDMNRTGHNTRYLGDIDLATGIVATTDLAEALAGAEAVLIVIPSVAIRDMCKQIAPLIGKGVAVAICAKGIEEGTGYLMGHIAADVLGINHPVGVISGPTFADETAMGHFTAATVAFKFSYDDRLSPMNSPAARMAVSMSTPSFRTYISDDLVGVEIGGAVKNVIAIACGMMTGAGFAENTRAALITRGMDEMKRLAEALGGQRETVTGLSGAGDLTLTCSSQSSRNMSLGMQLGAGIPRDQCFDGKPTTVEGEHNAITVTDLARRLGLALPICEAVRRVLHDGADLRDTFAHMWSSPIEAEPRAMGLSFDHPSGRMPTLPIDEVSS
ncbi:NAD(P)H-dependent glycerol-3-phosphate dehydrogenase [Oceaniglobus ichthyenteri]|uniref:NAD(P)H-dependent glycerol-3-phosphate dehydrogenase n=1 Tax=Oceaniglobus ichthyenteri TaxID=2136177 RepID=UPI000D3B00A6|nr:NAD(P)H-dependent glycerol-3-phosphate dehydrogenase [Oceaniglobus ichthyenteri]